MLEPRYPGGPNFALRSRIGWSTGHENLMGREGPSHILLEGEVDFRRTVPSQFHVPGVWRRKTGRLLEPTYPGGSNFGLHSRIGWSTGHENLMGREGQSGEILTA